MNLLKTFLHTCSHMSIYSCATVLLITCIAKMIFVASCTKGFRYLSVTLSSRWYSTLWWSISYIMSAHLAEPLSHCPFTTPSQTFVTSCVRKFTSAFKGMWRIKPCCNILIFKPEKSWLFRNTQLLQGLYTVGTHIKQSSNNYQSCIVADIKNITSVSPLVLPLIK